MRNKIYKLTTKEWERDILDNSWVIEIDGKTIKNWKDYANIITQKMNFPTACDKSYDVYLDWICDLSWSDSNDVSIVIINFDYFMKDNIELKKEIISDFENIILPWWEYEVEKCVVEGKTKLFNLYLIN